MIGELVGASEFPSGDLFCKWSVSHGSGWRLLEGAREGQTQTDHPQDGSFSKWSHPIGTISLVKSHTPMCLLRPKYLLGNQPFL